jgi:putative SOS response-associated peptidase YedK
MCGRFVQHADPEMYAGRYDAELDPDGLGGARASWNVAPTRPVLAIRFTPGKDGTPGRVLSALRWGLVPSWSKGPDNRYSMINARAETLASKPAYRSAFKRRRCLIPAEGFYEWRASSPSAKGPKQPYFIRRDGDASLLLAGLWESWRTPAGDMLQSCTIIVTRANAVIAAVHDRMPVVIEPAMADAWLDPDNADLDGLSGLLQPAPDDRWRLDPVSTRVNNVRHDGPELLDPSDAVHASAHR